MSARVSEGWSLHDIPALVLEIAAFRVTLLPELGGHVVELVVAEVRRDDHPGSSSQGRRNHVPVMFGHAAGFSRHPSTNLSIGQFRVLEREPEGFNNPNHAARRYSWIRPPSTSLRSTRVGVAAGTWAGPMSAGTARPRPRCGLSST